MKKVTRTVVGAILVLLGLLALLTPFSPGSWLILIGLELLGWRILLEDKLWTWAHARPQSRVARVVRRVLCLRPRDAAGRHRCRRVKEQE